jgi:type I restriction enzyme S subunit
MLGEVMQIVRGASPRPIQNFITTESDGVNWIKIGDVSPNDKYISKTSEKITREGAQKSRYLKPGDFILSNSMSFGRPYILKTDGCIHDGWIAMSEYDNHLISDYLYEVLNSNFVQDYWKQKANNGGAMSNLNSDIVKSTYIPIPSLSEQQRIVDYLKNFTFSIENLKEQITQRRKQYDYYRDQLLAFNGIEISEKLSLGRDFMLKARIGWQGLTKKEYRESGRYKLITGTDFNKYNRIDFDNCVYVDKDRYEQDPNIQIFNGDVLITKDGTLGKIAYIDNMVMPATLNGGVFVVRDLSGKVKQKFLLYYLTSNYFTYWMKSNHTQGSIQHLTQSLLSKFTIPVLSLEKQEYIIHILDVFMESIQNLEHQLTLREKQYKYYRNKLLTF